MKAKRSKASPVRAPAVWSSRLYSCRSLLMAALAAAILTVFLSGCATLFGRDAGPETGSGTEAGEAAAAGAPRDSPDTPLEERPGPGQRTESAAETSTAEPSWLRKRPLPGGEVLTVGGLAAPRVEQVLAQVETPGAGGADTGAAPEPAGEDGTAAEGGATTAEEESRRVEEGAAAGAGEAGGRLDRAAVPRELSRAAAQVGTRVAAGGDETGSRRPGSTAAESRPEAQSTATAESPSPPQDTAAAEDSSGAQSAGPAEGSSGQDQPRATRDDAPQRQTTPEAPQPDRDGQSSPASSGHDQQTESEPDEARGNGDSDDTESEGGRDDAEAPPEPSQMEIAVNSTFEISLPGDGWIYVGSDGGRDTVEFEGKRVTGQGTIFQFNVTRPGDYKLRFQKQDVVKGDIRQESVGVKAEEADSQQMPGELAEGRQEDAPASSEETEAEGSSTEGTASAAAGQSGEVSAAEEAEEPPRMESGGGAKTALALETENVLTDLGEEPGSVTPQMLVSLAERNREQGNVGAAIELCEEYIETLSNSPDGDYVRYMLGTLYETDSEHRDMKRALSYYQAVVDYYPLSRYYEPSRKRARYIDRHFFSIR